MSYVRNLRTSFERFCYKNRDKGIPNLMLYITIGNAIVLLLSLFNGGNAVYNLLCFDKAKILQGQVWRLVTYAFTQSGSDILSLLFLYFFYMLGRNVELSMGTFKFNLYYLSGIILMDVFAMIFCPTSDVIIGRWLISAEDFSYIYAGMAYYLHLSLLLLFATTYPDSQFFILMIIPIKAWVMGILYLVLTAAEIYNLSYPVMLFPHNLFPLVGLLNYLLFAGKDVLNLFPFIRRHPKKVNTVKKTGTIPFSPKSATPAYTHKCTICGRTDVSDPELEFRYCSRCQGYHCYCEDHINNHTHVQ